MQPPKSSGPHSSNSSGATKSSTEDDDDEVCIVDGHNTTDPPSHKSRSRPAGSKNKPKPPIIIKQESPTSLSSSILKIDSGADIMEAIAALARRRRQGISILSSTGVVTNVSIRQPATDMIVSHDGAFDIISLSGSFMPPPAPDDASSMTAFLTDREGAQIIGGRVAEELVAVGTVWIVAATFANATLESLPLMTDHELVAAQRQPNSKSPDDDDDDDEDVTSS